MNKLISLLLCLTLLFGLAACSTQTNDLSVPIQAVSEQSIRSDAAAYTDSASQTGPDEFTLEDVKEPSSDFSKYEEKIEYRADPEASQTSQPANPGNSPIDKTNQKTCYLSISCETILNNMGALADGKEILVPSDGIILPRSEVVFHEGESVFDVLQRETQSRMIHMESSFTPIYDSAYIKGIGNLYEFDCGSESGWQYSVNGWFPNYGASRCTVQPGDDIAFRYTCDLGRDLGAA